MQTYSSLQEVMEPDDEAGVLVHVAEPSRARWNHIDDLDSFFSRMYRYHQRHGFYCMLVKEILELNQFVFIVSLTTYLVYGIDYPVLFKDKPTKTNSTKVTLSDVILPVDECVRNFSLLTWVILVISSAVWIFQLIRGIYQMTYFWDIKQFYNIALKIEDKDLDNLTWHEVQNRVKAVQAEQLMCIHKKELTELDIYHRILRQRNYLIAMVNKSLLPPRMNVPFLGEVVYWTHGLRFNIQLLLFWSHWGGPFENPWHLREEYRKQNMRHELAAKLRRQILWTALINFIFSPVILLWQILYTFFNYAEIIRREPGQLGMRHWSLFGCLYLRHFNELDHELLARLTRAHRIASKYMAAFIDAMGAIIARYMGFICGAVLAVILLLAIYDEDVMGLEHLLTIASVLGVALAVCRNLLPDETIPWCPEMLLSNVLSYIHYLPPGWKGHAHTTKVRSEFQQLFQLRLAGLLEELLSPIITPYLLAFHVCPRALDIVDFFRNFTVSVVGVGDVCSFAQMDVRKHGNPEWQDIPPTDVPDQYTQGEDGKIELSLIHFTHTNPSWKPPTEAQAFIESVHLQSSLMAASRDYNMYHDQLDDSSLRFSSRIDTSEPSINIHMTRTEGPGVDTNRGMNYSAMYLHDQHDKLTVGSSKYVRRNFQETTPLLSSH